MKSARAQVPLDLANLNSSIGRTFSTLPSISKRQNSAPFRRLFFLILFGAKISFRKLTELGRTERSDAKFLDVSKFFGFQVSAKQLKASDFVPEMTGCGRDARLTKKCSAFKEYSMLLTSRTCALFGRILFDSEISKSRRVLRSGLIEV